MTAQAPFKSFFRLHEYDPELSVKSWFVSSRTLMIVRGLFTLYTWTVLIAIIALDINGRQNTLIYFTNLSFIGLVAYFSISTFLSYRYVIDGRFNGSKIPKILTYAHWTLYHTLVHFHLIVPIVYWAFLSNTLINGHTSATSWWRSLSVHAADFVFMISEVLLNRQIVIWPFCAISMLLLLLFMIESFIVHAVDGFWVYSFLSWDNGPKAIGWYIGLAIFFLIAFAVQMGIHKLRDHFGRKRQYRTTDETKLEVPMENIP